MIDFREPRAGKEPNISVFIMTLNEETNIERCLDSVRWSNDVVVLDSFSRDRTAELARGYSNVRIFQREFDGYSNQRNHGIHQIRYFNPWVLVLDADEVVEPMLAAELETVARRGLDWPFDVFLLRRKVFMENRWIRWNVSYDIWIARVFRPEAVHYEGLVHERLCFEGGYGCLKAAIEHHQFSKGLEDWLARRARYAKLEAEQRQSASSFLQLIWDLHNDNTLLRRAALKALFYRLPARHVVYFMYNFLFKFPYLDGKAGLRYVLLETYSQYIAQYQIRDNANAQQCEAYSTTDV